MEYLFIYSLQIADALFALMVFSVIVAIITGFLCVVNCCEGLTYHHEENEYLGKVFKKIFLISLGFVVVGIFFPTRETLLLGGATYYGKKAISTVATDEKIKKVDEIINLKLDKYIMELKGSNNGK